MKYIISLAGPTGERRRSNASSSPYPGHLAGATEPIAAAGEAEPSVEASSSTPSPGFQSSIN